MEGYLSVLAFAALPAVGNFAGGLLAEVLAPSQRLLGLALHAAAGIVLAVVAVELMPQALEAEPPWLIVLSFVLGGVFFVAVDKSIELVRARSGDGGDAGPWVIWFGVAVDLFSDGVMVGTGATVALGLGLLLALGQVPADIPEGFATISNFRDAGVRRGTRLLLSAAFAAPIFLGATLGYWGMRGQPELYKLMLLTFTAGVLTTLVVEELIPEAHEGAGGAEEEPRLAALVFVGGFALFALISAYFELDQG
ncbi:MAG: ZIP family metal transporter [Chloroflexota bacterium]|nr:ZIP family metal transporter [Chloroflexota bacterium]